MEAIKRIQHFTNRMFFTLVVLHVPLAGILGWIAEWREWWVYAASHLIPIITLLWYELKHKEKLGEKYALTAWMLPGLAMFLIYIARGTPWQADLHLYFFVILAASIFTFRKSIVLTTGASITLYYLIMGYFRPYFMVPGDETHWLSIGLHILFILLQTALGFCIIHIVEQTLKRPTKTTSKARPRTKKPSLSKKAIV